MLVLVSSTNSADEAYKYFCSELDYSKRNGLVELDSDVDDEFQRNIFNESKEKLGVDAVFFLKSETDQCVPLIYFNILESPNKETIAELHRKAWNMGQAPLLIIVLPDSVLIYSSYKRPQYIQGTLDPDAGFVEELKLFVESKEEIDKIRDYSISEMLTGNYWRKHSEHFKNENRIYQDLLENLESMRERLISKGLSDNVVHTLLIRSIFIKYLEDRKDKNGHNAFPKDFFSKFHPGAKNFAELLSDKNATEALFECLHNKFNGDLFAISEEEHLLSQNQLNMLQQMLQGNIHLKDGQMTLWPLYSFDVIPIELVSNIYQKFISHEEKERKNKHSGSHYTPYHLVSFLMDQVIPWKGTNFNLTILDPSCGSGVFLVEAYRRLISRKIQANPEIKLSINDLKKILRDNIYGVDINKNAIQIAALSLYLTMCDYLEPRYIWHKVKFEPLIGRNIFDVDFFEEDSPFLNLKYDLIIGNPPWESQISEKTKQYLIKSNLTVGDKQISQAFLWRVSELCKETGEICMLVSSKNLLFNRSKPNKDFRIRFFSCFDVKTVINFSAIRHILFSEAVAPPVAVIFSITKGHVDNILYCSPKPSYTVQDDWIFTIEPQDIAHIPSRVAIEDDFIWKTAMWGTPRDFELIKKLCSHPTLRELCEKNGWIYGEGFTVGKKDRKEDLYLYGKPYLDVAKINRYVINESLLLPLEEKYFARSRTEKREIYDGPHLLIRQSPRANVGMIAAVLKEDAVFRQAILGIHGEKGDINKLAAACLAINTNIALYYQMLTSRNWLVERDSFENEEILDTPIPEKFFEFNNIDYDYLANLSSNQNAEVLSDSFLMELYNLSKSDLVQIEDTINFTLDFFLRKAKSRAIKPVSDAELSEYTVTLCNTLNQSFSSPVNYFVGNIYSGEGPLKVVSLKLINVDENTFDCCTPVLDLTNNDLNSILNALDNALKEELSPNIFIRRNLRRYSNNTIFIVKPNEKRLWTRSTALRDADETYRDIMISSGVYK